MTQNKPLLITTLGNPSSGRTTFMVLLAEILYEQGYRCEYWNGEMLRIPQLLGRTNKIVVAPKILSLEHYNILCSKIPTQILINVHNGYSEFLEDQQWQKQIKPDYHILNPPTFQLFKFHIRNLFEEIKQNTKWKETIKCQ